MRRICRVLFVTLLFLSQTAKAAETYQLETDFGHYRFSTNLSTKLNQNYLNATYYFSKIDPKTYPLQEASFMARASGIGIRLERGSNVYPSNTSKDKLYGLNAFYASPDHPYTVAGRISEGKTDSGLGTLDSESKSFSVAPGYFLSDNFLLYADFTKSKSEYMGNELFENEQTALIARWLHTLPSGKIYNLMAMVARSNSNSAYSGNWHATTAFLSSDYYFTPAFSLGALIVVSDSSNSDSNDTGYGLSSTWFINSRLFARLSGTKNDGDTYGAKSVDLALGIRF